MTAKSIAQKILIIDDNPDDLEFYSELLDESGCKYKIFTAENSEDGIAIFKKEKIDCTFLDYNLPETDGLEVLESLRKDVAGKHLPVIIFTGEPHQKVQAEAARKGALDYVVKGAQITPEQLDELVSKAIEWAKRLNAEKIAV